MYLRRVKTLVLVFALIILFAGAFSIVTTENATAGRCCWVMVCTTEAPIVCWEECRPCPPIPPPWP